MLTPGTPDLPYYNGRPVAVGGTGWLVILASLAVALLALSLIPSRPFPLNLVAALLFLAIPLSALRLVTGPGWTALFRRVGFKSVGLIFLFALITLAGSVVIGMVLQNVVELYRNPVVTAVAPMSTSELAILLIPTVFQLIGEELFGVLPFLAVLWFAVQHLHLSRAWGIAVGLVVSGLLFGAAHLPTYDWHWVQALVGIGFVRVLLTLAYIVSRNLWVSAGAHILNDWAGILYFFGAGHIPISMEP